MLENTIIVGIKDESQHRRVQEKLFGMGCEWGWGGKEIKNYFPEDHIRVSKEGRMSYAGDERGHNAWTWYTVINHEIGLKEISASEFLGEREVNNNPGISINYKNGEMSFNSIIINTPNEPCVKGIIKRMPMCGESCINEIVGFAKNLILSADEKLLRKYGLHDSCGDATTAARDLVLVKLIKDNEPYLLEIAKAKQEEDKANK